MRNTERSVLTRRNVHDNAAPKLALRNAKYGFSVNTKDAKPFVNKSTKKEAFENYFGAENFMVFSRFLSFSVKPF